MTNRPKQFQGFMTVENGLPGFHKRDYTFATSTRKRVQGGRKSLYICDVHGKEKGRGRGLGILKLVKFAKSLQILLLTVLEIFRILLF